MNTFRDLNVARTCNIANANACLPYFLYKTRSMISYCSDEYNYAFEDSDRLARRPDLLVRIETSQTGHLFQKLF